MTRRTLFRRAHDLPQSRRIVAGALMLALLTATISVIGVAQATASTMNIFGSVTPANPSDTDPNAVELSSHIWVRSAQSGVALPGHRARIPLADDGATHRVQIVLG